MGRGVAKKSVGRKTKDIKPGMRKNPQGVARPGNNPMGNPRMTKDRPIGMKKGKPAAAKRPGVSKLPRGGAVGPFTSAQAAARKKAMMKRRGR